LHNTSQAAIVPTQSEGFMKRLFSGLMKILDVLRRTLLNLFFATFLLLFIVVIFQSQPSLPDKAVLIFNPHGKLVEQIEQPAVDAFPFAIPDANQAKIHDLVQVLKIARDDPSILAVRLDLERLEPSSLSKLQILRKAIEDFKSSGKIVLAASDSYDQSQYYLAAAANIVFLHPMGAIELTGFSVYRNYLRAALDKLDIDVHVFRAGEYKSAAEPFFRDSMSEADRKSNQVWLSSLWNAYKDDIAAMRHLDSAHFQALLDSPASYLRQYNGDTAMLFKAEGLVDQLGDKRDAESFLTSKIVWEGTDDIPSVDYKQYLQHHRQDLNNKHSAQKVGLIIASGPIVNGEQPAGVIGSDTLSDLLNDARKDEDIKAVVLRIDSPGGSALASEIIRKAVERLKESGKPVIISMASVAASGGYWIAADADEIWAQPTTLTGSIGVFGIVPNVSRGLENIGIHTDGLGTTSMSAGMRPDMPLSNDMKNIIQMGVDSTYQRFLSIVAQGRNMTVPDVDALAQGRVWSGVDALRLGLIDKIGNMDEAITSAATRAGIAADFEVQNITAPLAWPDILAERLFGDADALSHLKAAFIPSAIISLLHNPTITAVLQPLQQITQLNDPNHVYALSELPR